MKRWHWGGGFAAAVVFALVFLRSGETATPPLPPELQDEPDVYIEGAVITQYAGDGSIRYRIESDRIRQYEHTPEGGACQLHLQAGRADSARYDRPGSPAPPNPVVSCEQDGVATLDRPVLHLHRPGEAPWRVSAERGVLRTVVGTGRVPEEQLLLSEDVTLRRALAGGGFLALGTVGLYVYPERQYAYTDRPVMIEAPGRRTTAAGFEGDLLRGWMRLSSAPGQRVHITALPGRTNE